jgi:putative ABC transport system permease protein
MSAIRQLNPTIAPEQMQTLEERIIRQMASQHFGAVVLGSLGIVALMLTILGTYVLTESMSVSRTREMGIRAALGARRGELVRLVLADTGRLVVCGLAAGLALVSMGANTIRALLFGVQPLDPGTLVAVGTLIVAVAMTVALRPALRASRTDLATVLRVE